MSRTQRHLLSIRDLTDIEHMGESASGEANKVQDVSSFRGRKNTSGHSKAQSGENADKSKSCANV